MTDDEKEAKLEELKAANPEFFAELESKITNDINARMAEIEAKVTKAVMAQLQPPETAEDRQARIEKQIAQKVYGRAAAIQKACAESDLPELALHFISSEKSLELVQSELARLIGKLH